VRLVFCGTAGFAVPSLRACADRHDVLAVITRADRLGNRGKPAPRPVADAARELGLPVLMPVKIGAPEVVTGLLDLIPDCLVVAAYGQILPISLLDPLPFGAVNVHGSLLPRWRGASPIANAILAGDSETGVSIMRMEAGLDTGPVYAAVRIPIEDDATTPELTETLAELGASELVSVLDALERGAATATPQPAEGVTYAPRLGREDGRVDWAARSAVEVDRMVRALQPWPGVMAPIDGVDVQIRSGGPVGLPDGVAPGSVAGREGDSLVMATVDGGYRIDGITPPGKRAMSPAAWLRGRRSSEAAR
jgi:methionyl-tRNA formyltransferase